MELDELTSIDDLSNAIDLSKEKPVFLFKHSTRCPISTFAQKEYFKHLESADRSAVHYTFLDLIAHRDVSNKIAELTGLAHQSPQAILLVDGEAVWNDTHTAITADALNRAVENI
jgi:bacillithiol system protein YtxJ